jgi:hypothetical protein
LLWRHCTSACRVPAKADVRERELEGKAWSRRCAVWWFSNCIRICVNYGLICGLYWLARLLSINKIRAFLCLLCFSFFEQILTLLFITIGCSNGS